MRSVREALFDLMTERDNPAGWKFVSNLEMLNFVDYLIANDVTTWEEVYRTQQPEREKAALERLGEFGKLFVEYDGCPRGAMGRCHSSLIAEVYKMPELVDVDGGRWIPVNADALRELVQSYHEIVNHSRIPIHSCSDLEYHARSCADEQFTVTIKTIDREKYRAAEEFARRMLYSEIDRRTTVHSNGKPLDCVNSDIKQPSIHRDNGIIDIEKIEVE